MKLTRPDLARLIQWYHAVQDTSHKYLTGEDHALYRRLVSEVNGPIPEPGECIDADLFRFVEQGTKAWADVPDASDWVEEQRGNKPERCGECGWFRRIDAGGTGCGCPRVSSVYVLSTDKACEEAKQ